MEQIHEMIAYTAEALSYELPQTLAKELSRQLKELEALTELNADELAALDLVMYRFSLNELLISASDIIREKNMKNVRIRGRELNQTRADWMGRKVAGQDLRATNFRGAYLIAADLKDTDLRAVNFIGADLRDADFSGADLSASMFLTQMQINAAKGNNKTKLPFYLERPSHW
ncbi:pentapeptide repeat-containing protein [Terribacillus aidingensis]